MACFKSCVFDVNAYITKVELAASRKVYSEDKLAAALASRLKGAALKLYLQLTDDNKKDPERIREELHKIRKGKSRQRSCAC